MGSVREEKKNELHSSRGKRINIRNQKPEKRKKKKGGGKKKKKKKRIVILDIDTEVSSSTRVVGWM